MEGREDRRDRHRCRRRDPAHRVLVAVREHDDVVAACPVPFSIGERQPAAAAGDGVEEDDPLSPRMEHPGERRAALRIQGPTFGVLRPQEDGPSRRKRSRARWSGSRCSADPWSVAPPIPVTSENPASRSGSPVSWSWPSCRPASRLIVAQRHGRELRRPQEGTMKVTRPEHFHRSYAEAFNSGDIDRLLDHYERDATFVPQPGQTVSGRAAIGEALQQYQAVGKMTAETRYCVEAGDVALASASWQINGSQNGKPVEVQGTSAGSPSADSPWPGARSAVVRRGRGQGVLVGDAGRSRCRPPAAGASAAASRASRQSTTSGRGAARGRRVWIAPGWPPQMARRRLQGTELRLCANPQLTCRGRVCAPYKRSRRPWRARFGNAQAA